MSSGTNFENMMAFILQDKNILLSVICPFLPAYVLQVKVEMELEIQQYEKAKAVREEQLDRLTQICQEQAVCVLISSLSLVQLYSCV